MSANDWFRRNYPNAGFTEDQHRCLLVLQEWQALYNLKIEGAKGRPDGGFKKWGDGIQVTIARHFNRMSTFDDDGLTRLVLAAHKHCCRVELEPAWFGRLDIRIHPRSPGADQFWHRHPSLKQLALRAAPDGGEWRDVVEHLTEQLEAFVSEHPDPGTSALGALSRAEALLTRTASDEVTK